MGLKQRWEDALAANPREASTRPIGWGQALAVMAVLATLVIFLIANTVPGDPILAQLGDVAASNKAFVAEWRAKWGLDLPLWERYLIFLKGLVQGDLGVSIASQRPVLDDIAQFAPATLELATAGFLLSLSGLVQIPVALVLPGIANRARSQVGYAVGGTVLIGAGLAGVLLAPMAAPYLWVVLIGAGQGACFALGLNLMVLRTRRVHDTARVSAMAQSVGYTLCALGPLLGGLRHGP